MSNPLFDFFHTDEDLSRQLYGSDTKIEIDFNKLYIFDPEYAMKLLNEPASEIKYLTEYAKATTELDKEIHILNLPETTMIHELNNTRIHKLIQLEGTVIQRGNPLMRVTNLAFYCKVCGSKIMVKQNEQFRKYPVTCPSCEGRKFRYDYTHSEFTNYQEIYLQELLENTPNGASPDKIKAVLTGSLIRSCEPGESVKIIGILETYDASSKSVNIELNYHINAVSLINNTDAETLILTEQDRFEIQELMSQPNHRQRVINSLSPTIYGLQTVKEALAYQMCEGQVKKIKEERKRGQFHILLAGPPGCGKSELGDFMVKCHPKGRKAIGRGASAVGLTASVVKEGDQFVLKAGAMPLADNGFLFIDEIEKMSQTDSGAMHPGMEQQEIHIDKADISATLKTRCSVLAACNPIDGIWNDNKFPIQNLHDGDKGLSLTLLDRFALIFIIRQNKDSVVESDVLKHIMMVNSDQQIDTPYDLQTLRKIFAYARNIQVKLTTQVADELREFCMVLFEASKTGELSVITRRLPYDLIRLSEASARLHGRSETTIEDAENAKRMVAASLREYGLDPLTGKINQAEALYTEPKTRRQMMQECPQIVERLCIRNIDTSKVNRVEFVDYASKLWRVSSGEVGEVLNIALRDGTVFCPTPYTLAVTDQSTLLNSYSDTEEGDIDGEEA